MIERKYFVVNKKLKWLLELSISKLFCDLEFNALYIPHMRLYEYFTALMRPNYICRLKDCIYKCAIFKFLFIEILASESTSLVLRLSIFVRLLLCWHYKYYIYR